MEDNDEEPNREQISNNRRQNIDVLPALISFIVAYQAVLFIEEQEHTLLQDHIEEQTRMCRNLPATKTRPTWTAFCNRVSDSHFRRQFRMTRNTFTNLCSILCSAVGESTFCPESSILSTRNSASLEGRGGLIPGEVKAAISIRLLAGGSYLDLMPLYDISVSYIYVIFDEFLDWVLKAFEFPLTKYITDENWTALEALAEPFSYGSNGVFAGIIGALDGLAVRIRSPRLSEVSDPGNYYCRKGFFALNVQAICDRLKRFIWCYTSNKGSTHDSVAFSNSRLYSMLTDKAAVLEDKGFYLVGDSAYNLTPFLLIPYSTDEVRNDSSGMCDAFNFFLSSSRIFIECAFGELVMRWGILWRTLPYDLLKCQRIVQVCMLLHNHIKDEMEKQDNGGFHDEMDWVPTEELTQESSTSNERGVPLVSDNNAQPVGGRPSQAQELNRSRGDAIRRSLAVLLQLQDMRRPLLTGMRYNEFGHVYFDG